MTGPVLSLTPQRRAELDHAYRQTQYHVFAFPQPFLFTLDTFCPALEGHGCWAFVTACNPGSQWLPPEVNSQRMRQLEQCVAGHWEYLPAEGCSPDGRWREPSLWIRGIGRSQAIDLAEAFGQLALVWGDPQPQLLWTRWADQSEAS